MIVIDFENLIIAALFGSATLLLLIYTGIKVSELMKIRAERQRRAARLASDEQGKNKTLRRRGRITFPGITCSLPIHQEK